MKEINTVNGKIKACELGATLIHEHLGDAGDWCVRKGIPGWIDEDDMTRWRVKTAQYTLEAGVQTVVDCSIMNLGRSVPMMQAICQKTELQMIAATGFYYPEMLWMYSATDEAIFRILMHDLEIGMDGTNVKAGIIKCATGADAISKTNERILRISARAHNVSGVPILTHSCYENRGGLLQQDIFESEGVDLSTVMIGHLGDTNDLDYIEAILRRGSYIGLDRFSQDAFNSLENRCHTLVELIKRGWVYRILISHDYPLHLGKTFWKEIPRSEHETSTRRLQYISHTVLPKLKSLGVTDRQIHTILYENPYRFFAHS